MRYARRGITVLVNRSEYDDAVGRAEQARRDAIAAGAGDDEALADALEAFAAQPWTEVTAAELEERPADA